MSATHELTKTRHAINAIIGLTLMYSHEEDFKEGLRNILKEALAAIK